ncbi:MAG: DNA cytosine methyltransferase [Hyphomicrobium sp.]
MAFTFYEFFAGGGMARTGLGPGWGCALANDLDAAKAASYAANHGAGHLIVGDIREISPRDCPGRADLAWASFPCQDLSLAGRGAGLNGARSGAFWAFWTLIRNLATEGRAPRIVALENVVGVLTSNGGQDFATIAAAVTSLGYRFGALVIDAADYVPQSRPRVFMIAVADDAPIAPLAQSATPAIETAPSLIAAHAKLSKAVARKWIWWRLDAPAQHNAALVDLIETKPGGVEWRSKAETDYLLALMSASNREKVARMQALGGLRIGAVYRRTRRGENGQRAQRAEVRFDGLAGCLRTPGGGSSRQTLLIVEGASMRSRLLSPREAARLMGLPDSYILPNRYNQAYHLLGDGVVAPIVRHLAAAIFEPILSAAALRASA